MKRIIITLSAMILLSLTVYAKSDSKKKKGGQDKQVITIKNNYRQEVAGKTVGQEIACQLQWRDSKAPHTKRMEDVSVPAGHTDNFTAPISTYKLEEITATPSAVVAEFLPLNAVTLGTGEQIYQGIVKSHGNSFFVVSAGPIPDIKTRKADTHKADIKGYKNKEAFENPTASTPQKNNKKSKK